MATSRASPASQTAEQLGRVGRRLGLVAVAEVDVGRLRCSADTLDEVVVRREPAAQIPEGPRVVEVVDAHGAGLGEARLDAVPRLVLEVEREAERRIERS